MATTLKQTETVTLTDAIWARIEAYIAHRFASRSVEWIVEGPGEWCPPLTPATITTIETWNGTAWETITVPDSPLGGYWLSGEGPYRFAGTVGAGPIPLAVQEAYNRLQSYFAEDTDIGGGVSEMSTNVGPISISEKRQTTWLAKAMQNSGAADLLRPYRRAS